MARFISVVAIEVEAWRTRREHDRATLPGYRTRYPHSCNKIRRGMPTLGKLRGEFRRGGSAVGGDRDDVNIRPLAQVVVQHVVGDPPALAANDQDQRPGRAVFTGLRAE